MILDAKLCFCFLHSNSRSICRIQIRICFENFKFKINCKFDRLNIARENPNRISHTSFPLGIYSAYPVTKRGGGRFLGSFEKFFCLPGLVRDRSSSLKVPPWEGVTVSSLSPDWGRLNVTSSRPYGNSKNFLRKFTLFPYSTSRLTYGSVMKCLINVRKKN